jgi:hypothetical protein
MKRLFIAAFLLLLVLCLSAQYLIKDNSGTPVPYLGTSWLSQTVACTADTVLTEVEIPDGTFEMLIQPSADIKIAADSLYAAADNYEITLTDTTAFVALPVHNMATFWIRRASAGTGANLLMIFKKW